MSTTRGLPQPGTSPQAGSGARPRVIVDTNPADVSDVLADVPQQTADDVARAVERAQDAFRVWRATPPPERGRVLAKAAVLARTRLDELARLLTREEGKILSEARGEVMKGINLLEWYAGEGFRIGGKTRPSEMPTTVLFTLREPLGVVAIITPWNFPWAEPAWKVAPALVAGNAVILKPASLTPLVAQRYLEILEEAGLPKGVLTLVVGPGSEVGDALVAHPAVRAVSFTGSCEIGGEVYARDARRLAKVSCEMGGKNAVVVMPDADLDLAACGGRRLSDGALAQGYFIEPTVFTDVQPGSRIAQEEIFGPVLSVIEVGSLDEALRVTNGVRYGLSASIYAADANTIMRFVDGI